MTSRVRTSRLFATATALVAVVAFPTLSSAATPTAADNCMKALVDSLSIKVKVVDSQFVTDAAEKGMLGYYQTTYTVVAKQARTGRSIASATCTVDRSGEVIELHHDLN